MAGSMFCRADVATDLERAAQSPYDIQEFVDTHAAFKWNPLWRALKLTDDTFLPECEERSCSAKLISVGSPEQVIVILHHEPSWFEVYLRFVPVPSNGERRWRFAGHYQPNVKYFPPRHRIAQFGQRPYLVVTEQGVSGTGVSSEVETWIDLTISEMRSVFSYTSKGYSQPFPRGVSRAERATILSLKSDPTESIRVQYSVEFETEDASGRSIRLGRRMDTAVYTRQRPGEDFTLDGRQSPGFSDEVDALYNDFDGDPKNEDFLKFDFTFLKKLASGPNGASKRWLRQFLANCGETTEKKQLMVVLGPPSRRSK